jgi:hypothetical protein
MLRDRVRGRVAADDEASTTQLGDWFATALFWRPHVALLVNERTFVPVLMPLAPASKVLDRMPAAIESVLRLHGVGEAFIAAEVTAMTDIRIAPTNSASVLGVMNGFAAHGEALWKLGLEEDVDALSLLLAQTPLRPLRARTGSPDRELAAIAGSTPPDLDWPRLRAVPLPSPSNSPIYQLKITIADTTPPVWRRVLVHGDISLDRLHDLIQAALGWWNHHLHEFEFDEARFGVPDGDDWEPPEDERRARLDSLSKEGSTFRYTYDFGDDWGHDVVVEKVLPADPSARVPACVDGGRACPPEDCGGPWGYQELLTILADPAHPEHDERRGWFGAIDPDAFDPTDFDANLAQAKRVRRGD